MASDSPSIDVGKLKAELRNLHERERELDDALSKIIPRNAAANTTVNTPTDASPDSDSDPARLALLPQFTPEIDAKLRTARMVFDAEQPVFSRSHEALSAKVSAHVETIESISDKISRLDTLQGNCDAVVTYIDDYVALTECLATVQNKGFGLAEPQTADSDTGSVGNGGSGSSADPDPGTDLHAAVELLVKFHTLSSKSMYKADEESLRKMDKYHKQVHSALVGQLTLALETCCEVAGVSANSAEAATALRQARQLALLMGRLSDTGEDPDAVVEELVQLMVPPMRRRLAGGHGNSRSGSGNGSEHSSTSTSKSKSAVASELGAVNLATVEAHEKFFKDLLNVSHFFVQQYGTLVFQFGTTSATSQSQKGSPDTGTAGANDTATPTSTGPSVAARSKGLEAVVAVCDEQGASAFIRTIHFVDGEVARMTKPNPPPDNRSKAKGKNRWGSGTKAKAKGSRSGQDGFCQALVWPVPDDQPEGSVKGGGLCLCGTCLVVSLLSQNVVCCCCSTSPPIVSFVCCCYFDFPCFFVFVLRLCGV